MNQQRKTTRPRSRTLFSAAAVLALGAAMLPRAMACLTSNIDKRTVQWSSTIVQAKLVDLGTKRDLSTSVGTGAGASVGTSAGDRTSGKPMPTAYRVVSFEVTDVVEGSIQPGQTVKTFSLIGGRPGDGTCPTLMRESVGKKFILMLRPFDQTRMDLPTGASVMATPSTMVIVSQLGEDDMNADTLSDLKKLVTQTNDASSAVSSDTITSQVEAIAAAHDATEAEQAEKTLQDIGPAALPALQERIKSASGVGKTRLSRLIADLQPPMLTAEPE